MQSSSSSILHGYEVEDTVYDERGGVAREAETVRLLERTGDAVVVKGVCCWILVLYVGVTTTIQQCMSWNIDSEGLWTKGSIGYFPGFVIASILSC